MKIVLITAAMTAATVAAPTLAQTASNTGPRIEATVGWDHVGLHADGDSEGKSGVTYGGELGYDLQLNGGMVLGAYAGIDGSSTKDCVSEGTETACIKAGRNLALGVRAGGHIGPNSLAYVKGGYSNGRIEGTYTDTAFPADNDSGGQDLDGFHVGAGIQAGMSNGFYAKAEYVYTRYSTNDLFGDDTRVDRHRVIAGVGYRF